MKIGLATQGDALAMAQIHRAARKSAMPWLPDIHSANEDLRYFSTQVLPIQQVLIARADEQSVGFIACHEGWLNHLYISPNWWRGGIGTQLLAAARSTYTHLQLWVFQQNIAARHFYSKNGFVEREFTDGRDNEEKSPDLRMEWTR